MGVQLGAMPADASGLVGFVPPGPAAGPRHGPGCSPGTGGGVQANVFFLCTRLAASATVLSKWTCDARAKSTIASRYAERRRAKRASDLQPLREGAGVDRRGPFAITRQQMLEAIRGGALDPQRFPYIDRSYVQIEFVRRHRLGEPTRASYRAFTSVSWYRRRLRKTGRYAVE